MNKWQLGQFNKSDIYILPMIGAIESEYRSEFFPQAQFCNCFLGDTSHDVYKKDYILLLYRIPFQSLINIKVWLEFEKSLCANPFYLDNYRPDKFHTMFVYKIPEKFRNDYELFKLWKPSNFTPKYKEHIRSFYGNIDDNTKLMQTLNKAEELFIEREKELGISIPRTQEASSSPYWENEYYCEDYRLIKTLEKHAERY